MLDALNPLADAALLQTVENLARRAGAAILAVGARADHGVRHKADASRVSDADIAAHDVICAELARCTPQIPVLSEEDVEGFALGAGVTFWCVDPLDGTEEFLRGGTEYCVNIALVHSEVPVLGVIHEPLKGLSYGGGAGLGAWRFDAHSERMPLAGPLAVRSGEPLQLLTSRWHNSRKLQALLECLPPHHAAPRGAALKLAHLADGQAHASVSGGGTKIWDTAAGDAVLRACGVRLLGPDGQQLRCSAQELSNPAWVASALNFVPGRRASTEPLS